MADFRIKLGVDVETKDISTTLNGYKAKPIDVKAKLDTSGIDTKIRGYKAPKQIEVTAKLNSKKIDEKIRSYTAPKQIEVNAKLSTKDITKTIEAYNSKTPIKVDVKLNTESINSQISGHKVNEQIIVDAKLNDNAIGNAIKNYSASQSIKVDVDPDFTNAAKKISGYQMRNMLKVNVKLNKTAIDSQIKNFQTSKHIEVGARLRDNAIESAIAKYTAKELVPVTVDFKAGEGKEVSQKISEYKNTPVEVPVKLKPAAKGFDSSITKKPVQVEAELKPNAINNAIENHKTSSKIPVDVKLQPKDINAEIAGLKSLVTEPLNVDVKLNDENINTSIASIKPTATIDVKSNLILEDVDDQIKAYVPKAQIKVNVKLDDDNIDEKTGKQNLQPPIQVNVKLDRDNIDEQIKGFKTNAKVKVGVKLDFASHKDDTGKEIQKGVSKQLKEFETKSKIKVGVELDKDGIAQEIQGIDTGTPIKLGVELDRDSVLKQVEDIRQQLQGLGNITIHFGSDIVDAAKSVARTGSSNSEAAKAASRVIRQTEKLVSDDAEKSINKITSKGIGKYFRISKTSSDNFDKEMEKLVNQWTKGKGSLVGVNIKTRTSWDEEEKRNVERLHQAQVEYNNELGVTQKKTIAWRKIGTKTVKGKTEDVYGFAEVSGQYSKSIDKTKNKTDIFVKQQKKAVSDLTNQANQLNRAATDQNAARPIKDKTHLDALSKKYTEITDAITRMGNASSNTFDDERNNVNKLISEYKSMKSEFKNAENVANKLSGTDYQSGRKIAEQNLEEFKTKAKEYAQMSSTIGRLDESFKKVGDASSLKEFNNQLRVAKAELSKVKAEIGAVDKSKDAANKKQNLDMDVFGLKSEITDLQRLNPGLDKFEANIDGAKISVNSLLNELSQVKTKGDFSVVNNKFKEFTDAAKNAGIAINDTVVKAKTIKDIKGKLADVGFDGFGQEVARAHADIEKLNTSSLELQSAMQRVDNALNAVQVADDAGDMKALVAANEEYEESLKRLYSQINLYQQAQKESFNADNLELDKANALLKLEGLFEEGSQAAKKYAAEVQRLKNEINDCVDGGDMQKINKQISILDKEVKNSGLQTQTFGSKIKAQFSKYKDYFGVAEVFMYVEQGLRDMFQQVVAIDTAMTELKKVTNETDASYDKFLSNAANRAKEIGTTIDGLVTSTADFARLGYDFEQAAGLAEVANIYTVVGDEIDGVEDATQSLVSTLAAFKHEMGDMSDSDFAMSIVDKMNEVSNNFAISSGGIGEALQRSASSMAAANNTLDETIAMITAANEVAQNPEKVGNAMKTISMRMKNHCPQ